VEGRKPVDVDQGKNGVRVIWGKTREILVRGGGRRTSRRKDASLLIRKNYFTKILRGPGNVGGGRYYQENERSLSCCVEIAQVNV